MKKIINKIKNIFIPHYQNDHKPHFFREASIFSIVAISIFVLSISVGSRLYIKSSDMLAEVLPSILVDMTNNSRSSAGISHLSRSSILDQAAQMKANDMAEFGYFSHTSPYGVTPWNWFKKAGYNFIYAGENLAINFSESLDVNNAWLDSPTHKANILNDKFTEIGIATKEGYYNGLPTVYVVQMFGKPSVSSNNDVVLKNNDIREKEIDNNIKKIDNSLVALESSVKGETFEIKDNFETIINTEEFISIKNNSVNDDWILNPIQQENYSKWYQRFLVQAPSWVDYLYKIIIWIVSVALVLMILIEIRIQKTKNIIYGILTLVILMTFLFINRSIFLIDLF